MKAITIIYYSVENHDFEPEDPTVLTKLYKTFSFPMNVGYKSRLKTPHTDIL